MTHPSQKPYKTIRAVVECRVPQHVTEKSLVSHLRMILGKWPIQLGFKGDRETLVRPEFKSYSRVRTAEIVAEERFMRARVRNEWGRAIGSNTTEE